MNSLDDIKAGDAVARILKGIFKESIEKVIVDRVTKTQVIIRNKRYRKSDGEAIGQSRDTCYVQFVIRVITPEIEEKLKEQELKEQELNNKKYYIHKIVNFNFYKLSLEKLRETADAIGIEAEKN